MESKVNQIFECSEEGNITWKEVYEKIPKLLKMIQQILEKKSEDIENNVDPIKFLDYFDLGIKADEPYIMQDSDFDKINFYEYILKTAIYYLNQSNINIIINMLNPPVFKHLIDLCLIIQRILNEEKNYESREVKYYIYHIVNAFSDAENKIEKDFKFLKCGIELLLKTYNINDYEEYFSNKDKAEIRRNFCSSLKNLLACIQQYMIDKKYLEEESKVKIFEEINELCGKARKLRDDKTDINFIENVKSFLNELYNSLNNEKVFESIYTFINIFKRDIPENLNDFYYSIFCFDYINKLEKYKKKLDTLIFIDQFRKDFNNNCICDSQTKKSLLTYTYQFMKNKKMYYKLLSGMNSNQKYFEELLNDKKFTDKIINFYSSQTIKDFIKERCNNKEKEKLMEKLPYLLDLMKNDDFWRQIMLFPMSKNKMASVENYLRIVINTEYVKYHDTPDNYKMAILNLLLFELLIHEIFHFLRRLIFLGKKAKEAITPPSSYDKCEKVNKEDKSSSKQNNKEKDENENKTVNEKKQYGEIGQRLIRYIFNVDTIISISYAAGKKFEDLTLKDDEEIKSLKTILSNEHTSYATFSLTEMRGITHKIHDCREYYCTSGC